MLDRLSGILGISALFILGMVGLLLDYAGFFELPDILKQIIVLVEVGLGALGYREMVDEGARSIREAVASWKSSNTFIGFLVVFLEQIFVAPELVPVPEVVQEVLRYVGIALL